MSPQKLKVSQVARIAGVGSDSIRHYERIGILPKAERSPSGYRMWNAHDVRYLKWIALAKRVGFTLRELTEIFQMYRAGRPPCHSVRDLLQRKLIDWIIRFTNCRLSATSCDRCSLDGMGG